jgi:predicted DsbA family dithiol-disulfide isomerase
MDFAARVYFDFESKDSWRLHQLFARAESEGSWIVLDWTGFTEAPPTTTASARTILSFYEWLHRADPPAALRFVHMAMVLLHSEKAPADDPDTLLIAAKAAGVEPDVCRQVVHDRRGELLLNETMKEARSLGVTAVPSLYRAGAPLHIGTTPVVLDGNATARLSVFETMLGDDGLWSVSKPPATD